MASNSGASPKPGTFGKLPPQGKWAILQSRRLWLGAMLGVACLVLAMADIDYVELATTLRLANLAWVAIAAVTVLLTGCAKAWRWHLLLYPERQPLPAGAVGVPRLTNIWLAGAGVNLALPLPRVGDILRIYLAGETGRLSKSLVLGTIAAEKLLDLVLLALCFLGLLLFVAMPDELAQRQVSTLGITGLLVIVVGVLLWQRQRLLSLLARAVQRIPYGARLADGIDRGLHGMAGLGRPGRLLGLTLLTVGIWFLSVLTAYVVFLALNMPPSWAQSLFVLVVLQVGVAVPSTPGKIGVFQVLCQWALAVFGVSTTLGLAYGVVLYLAAPLLLMVTGAVALAIESWRIGRLPTDLELELSSAPIAKDTALGRDA